jgi:hypothetical protein
MKSDLYLATKWHSGSYCISIVIGEISDRSFKIRKSEEEGKEGRKTTKERQLVKKSDNRYNEKIYKNVQGPVLCIRKRFAFTFDTT